MGNLILIRHGESELNKEGIFFGQLDPNLTEKGREQGAKARKILKGIEYEKIYTSPLKRALETAEIININQKELIFEDRLKELNFGILEGMTYDEILKKYPKEAKKLEEEWQTYNYQTGESLLELQKRVIDFIKSIDLGGKNIILVCHWGVINSILSYYFSKDLNGYWKYSPNYAGITIIEFTNNYPILKGLNVGEINGII